MSTPSFTEAAARDAHCWFSGDRISSDPESTSWRRLARWHQAQWRAAQGYPIGARPYAGGDHSKPFGSRLSLDTATRESGRNFLTSAIRGAVKDRLQNSVKHQVLQEDRLWANLLSSMPLCFNLFGDLFGDAEYARRAVRAWWPDAPEGSIKVRFEHSPGHCDPAFLGNKSAFDVAFEIGSGDKDLAIIGVETKYHEEAKIQPKPKKKALARSAKALARYVEVAERSKAFIDGWRELVIGTELHQIWLDHLLLLSMLQHPSGRWTWGRFVLLYPSGNPSFARAAAAYQAVLRDPATFEARTIEALLAPPCALKSETVAALRERYFW